MFWLTFKSLSIIGFCPRFFKNILKELLYFLSWDICFSDRSLLSLSYLLGFLKSHDSNFSSGLSLASLYIDNPSGYPKTLLIGELGWISNLTGSFLMILSLTSKIFSVRIGSSKLL